MRAFELSELESRFDKNLKDSAGKTWKVKAGTFSQVKRLEHSYKGYYVTKTPVKKHITLHQTLGVLPGDIATLTKQLVSVPYVIARSGIIYELFNPDYFSYHLGPSKGYNNYDLSGQSIGIEISGLGPLRLKENILYDIYKTPYCGINDVSYYDKCSYRGYEYYTKYTPEQYESLKYLSDNLCKKYSIPKTFLSKDLRYDFNIKAALAVGIYFHSNVRADKTDLPPNFDTNLI